ncbi:MAG: hypothetical protein ACYDAO_10565 [Thermoplasmataceae archaeon]
MTEKDELRQAVRIEMSSRMIRKENIKVFSHISRRIAFLEQGISPILQERDIDLFLELKEELEMLKRGLSTLISERIGKLLNQARFNLPLKEREELLSGLTGIERDIFWEARGKIECWISVILENYTHNNFPEAGNNGLQ